MHSVQLGVSGGTRPSAFMNVHEHDHVFLKLFHLMVVQGPLAALLAPDEQRDIEAQEATTQYY